MLHAEAAWGHPCGLSSSSRPPGPECAAAVNRNPTILCRQRHHAVMAAGKRLEGTSDSILDLPHVVHLSLLIRFAPADGDQHTVAVCRIDDIGAAQRTHLAAPRPRH